MHVFSQSVRFCRNICTCKAVRRENDVVDGCVTFLSLPSNVARKRLVTSIPWGGEEKAQEEASRSESQLLLYGCEMSRYSHITLIGWENSGTTCGIVTWVILFFFLLCLGCYKITTVFSHAQTVVLCVGCSTVLCQPTGGKARLTEGQSQPGHVTAN